MNGYDLLSVARLKKIFHLHLQDELLVEPIEDLSFRLKEQEFGVITGPSGAGKTTVLKCIYRSYLPTSGAIHYRLANGSWVDLATCPERDVLEVRKREIALVTQFFRCAPRVPTEEVVASPRVAQGVGREEAVEESRTLLRRFNVPEKLWRAYPVTFSGGEQQRVNLARAIVQKPRLLLLDEPTASLDEKSVHAFLQALEDVRRHDTTCLAVFHNQELIRTLATQVISWPLKSFD
jgi:alpha-D-ribose 1-methylphosphonate 5-triphosphate synthase subunit PhnL